MTNLLFPRIYVGSLFDIPLEELRQDNIKAFIFDLDNTLTEWNSQQLNKEVEEWFILVREKGFKACILSNNGAQRIVAIADKLGIPFIHRAQKPRRRAFFKAVQLMGVENHEAAVIGDQVFTDILGGNRAGLFTILVKPLNKKEFLGTKFSRSMEFFVLRCLRRRWGKEGKKLPQ